VRQSIFSVIVGLTVVAMFAIGAVKILPVKPGAAPAKPSAPPQVKKEIRSEAPPAPAKQAAAPKHQSSKQKQKAQRVAHIAHKGHLNGMVMAAKKGPVARARVTFVRHGHVVGRATTNKSGAFHVKRAAGSYQVRAFKKGAGKGSAKVSVASGQTSSVTVQLHSKHHKA
jgi:hypothetical protein